MGAESSRPLHSGRLAGQKCTRIVDQTRSAGVLRVAYHANRVPMNGEGRKSMKSEDWAAVLLDGLLAAVVGLVGVVVALAVTRRHERQHLVQARMTDSLVDASTLTFTGPDGSPEEVLAWVRRLMADVMTWGILAGKTLEYHVAWGNTITSYLMKSYVADTQAHIADVQAFVRGAGATPIPRPNWARVSHVAEQIQYGIEELVKDKPNKSVLSALLTNAHHSHWPNPAVGVHPGSNASDPAIGGPVDAPCGTGLGPTSARPSHHQYRYATTMSQPSDLPSGESIPDGTIALDAGDGTFVLLRRCDICFAAVIEAHDADHQEHLEWHERTGTNSPPSP